MSKLNTAVFAIACAALLARPGSLLRAADQRITTNLPEVSSAPAPPLGFDPVSASDMELDIYGFPSRPDQQAQPDAYALWAKAMRSSKQRLVPELRMNQRFHGPAQGPMQRNANATTFNWSGSVMTDGASSFFQQTALNRVFAYIVAPVANQTFGRCNGWVYSAEWAGIDGFGSNDVLQAGVAANNLCINYPLATYYIWYEWFPNYEIEVTNLPVSPGDTVFVSIAAGTATSGQVYLLNANTNQYVSITINSPTITLPNGAQQQIQLTGNVAECVVERPTVNGVMANLTNYVYDYFADCLALNISGSQVTPASPSSKFVTMLDNNSQPISAVNLLGPTGLWFEDMGSAK
jgi:hypothetical protein